MNRFLQGVAFVALIAAGLPLQAQGRASPADLRYCSALSELYRAYVGNPQTEPRNIRRNDVAGDDAVAQCRAGNAAGAIPVLERKLAGNGITLPARE